MAGQRNWLGGIIGLAALGTVAWRAVQTTAPMRTPIATISSQTAPVAAPAEVPKQAHPDADADPYATARMSPIELKFIALIGHYAEEYRSQPNEMLQGRTRPERARAICTLFQTTNQHHVPWAGVVKELSSTNSGKGVLTIAIGDDITIGTTNNEFSNDLGPATLLEPGTAVYEQVAHLHLGQKVFFTGGFPPSKSDCFEEASLLQENSMTSPHWHMRFTMVAPISDH